MGKLTDEGEELPTPEEAERTAVFWGAEANKAMLQGDHNEARRCLGRAKRHALNAARLRLALASSPDSSEKE